MALSSDNAIMVLQLLAECGRVSRAGLLAIMPYTYRNKCVVIKRLVDNEYIKQTGPLVSSSYTLLAKGRDELSRLNPQRYTPDMFELHGIIKRHGDRSKRRGDVAAAMSLAGYAVNPADKPALPATTPAFQEHTAEALKTLYRNERPHVYGEIFPNHTQYTRRITPINFYYDCLQIKDTRELFENKGTNYSRATGILFTPAHLFRVYHGEKNDLQISPTGEKHFYSLVQEVFSGYMPKGNQAVLLFGKEFAPAISLLDIYLNNKRDIGTEKTLLGPTNLGKPLFYLPHAAEALELLRVMRFPDWDKAIATFASDVHFGIPHNPEWHYSYEGQRIYFLADLNISHTAKALQEIKMAPKIPVLVLCLPWQVDFFEELLKFASNDNRAVKLHCLPADFLTTTALTELEDYWGGDT